MKTKLVEEKKITTENILQDVCNIIDEAKSSAYTAVNVALVKRNWLIGKRIAEEELKGKARADYGDEVIRGLAKDLTKIYGKGFTMSNLYHFLNFYKCFPEIFYTVCRKSRPLLSWSHYRILLQVQDQVARNWYESEEGDSTMIETGQAFNTSYNNNAYVGYMYESGEVHGLTTNSSIKTKLDEWYFANLAGEADKLDGNAGFCGDRYPSTITTSSNGSGGSGTATTHYGAYIRLISGKNPSFKCTDKDNDLYTTPGSSKGNGALKVSSTDERPTPIGLITADEVAFAGGVYGSTNTSYYLYNNASYWTMSPYWYGGGAAYVFRLNSGFLSNWAVNGTAPGVRPVINIRSDVEITGSGTTTDPFAVVS